MFFPLRSKTALDNFFLVFSTRSKTVLPYFSSSIACARESSSVHSRSLLDCLCSTVLLFQQILAWLKPPMRTRDCEHEGTYRIIYLLLPPDQEACKQTMSLMLICPLILTHKHLPGLPIPRQNSTHSHCSLTWKSTLLTAVHPNLSLSEPTPGHSSTPLVWAFHYISGPSETADLQLHASI